MALPTSPCASGDKAGITFQLYTPNSGFRFPCGEGNGSPLQYSCLGNPIDRGAWWAAVHGVVKNLTRLSAFTFTFHFHELEKEMATHSSILSWRAAVFGVAQSQTRLQRLSSSSSVYMGLPQCLSKKSACNTGDKSSILGVGRSPGGGHGYPLQYSCLENPMDRGAWRATIHRVAESDTTEAT